MISAIAEKSRADLLRRNPIFEEFFQREAPRLSAACLEMGRRFLEGGRLLAFGQRAAATDAQHVSVEFVHPVIVGKRALPAIDLGSDFAVRAPVLVNSHDMVMGFAFPAPDPAVEQAVAAARAAGALTFGLSAESAEYAFAPPDDDLFVCQEIFEVLYHVLWETVHVFLEHREQGREVGAASFLYPFLGKGEQSLDSVVKEVEQSMIEKAAEVNRMRAAAAETETPALAETARALVERIGRGGKLILFGNGGSATDANDLAMDCVNPPSDLAAPGIPALSLSTEPANVTAIANDIGCEAIFTRQLIAHARPEDAAIAISTSGGSANLLSALIEARKRGLLTVGIVGYDGGRIVSDGLVDHALIVRSDYVPRIQEVQASLYHVLRRRMGELQRDGLERAG